MNDGGKIREPTEEEQDIVKLAKKRYRVCEDWEAQARLWFDYDYKFANGDTHNKYQWEDKLVYERESNDKPCLTINKTQQHNLLIINDAKQNKPGVRIRPVGEEASFEAAQLFQELVYHTEYISNAENVYDSATTWQVEAGIGYWRIVTDYISEDSFDQEIYIRRIKDPRSVYLDPDINEVDGSDARFGFVFEDMPKDLFDAKYPDFTYIAASVSLGNASDGWTSNDHVRVAEYYYKEEKKDKLVTFIDPQTNQQVIAKYSDLSPEGKSTYQSVKKQPTSKERKLVTNNIRWCKIAGDEIIEETDWLGKYIPIIRLPGTETVIDGVLDRKGHTRALINAQQIYNYNTSANVEYGALQTKSPWIAPTEAIEGYEDYWSTANTRNHSYLPYNHMSESGEAIPPPSRPQGPQSSPAYVQQMQIAQNEMMMASGQYQSQFGENENAKSGVAINARQRQGDRSTYHFPDNQAIAIRNTGKQLVDLYPKIYDTKRIMQITAKDGSKMNITVDPNAKEAFTKTGTELADNDPAKKIENIIFNPNVGTYDVQSDTGPSFATRRMEGFNALTQIAAQNKDFMNMIGGDIYFKYADFPGADILAERYARIIPPKVTGQPDAVDPQTEELMHQASDHIQQLTQENQQLMQKVADRQQEFAAKHAELELKSEEVSLKKDEMNLAIKKTSVEQIRLDYDAETKRLVALGNSGPAISIDQIQPVIKQMLRDMLRTDLTEDNDDAPMAGAKKAPDGNWYISDPERAGKYLRVDPDEQEAPSPPDIPDFNPEMVPGQVGQQQEPAPAAE